MASRYTLTPVDVQAVNNTAARLGIKPADLIAVMHYETIGTMNPAIKGGAGNNYQGLIQFGGPERRKYGYDRNASFAEQVEGPVYRYFKDRNLPYGADLSTIYRTVIGGNPKANLNLRDGPIVNGHRTGRTIAEHIQEITARSLPLAGDILGGAPPDVQAMADVAALNPPTGAEQGPPSPLEGFMPSAMNVAPAQAAISDMLEQPSGDLTADQIDELTKTDVAGNYLNQPQSQPLQLPPQWNPATGFPQPPQRPGPGGALGVDLGMQPAGMPVPQPRPAGRWQPGVGGAPAAGLVPTPGISPFRPAMGGPNDRRPQPPVPTQRPAVGIPDPRMRPANYQWLGGGAPDAGTVPSPPPRGTPYTPGFPPLYGEQPAPPAALQSPVGARPEYPGQMPAAPFKTPYGGPPPIAGASPGGMPAARPTYDPLSSASMPRPGGISPLFDPGSEYAAGIRLYRPNTPQQPPAPPPAATPPWSPTVAGRPEYPGAMPAAPRTGDLPAAMGGPPAPQPSFDNAGPGPTFTAPLLDPYAEQRRLNEENSSTNLLQLPPGWQRPTPAPSPSVAFNPPSDQAYRWFHGADRGYTQQGFPEIPLSPPSMPSPYGLQAGAMTGEGAPSAPTWGAPPGVSGMTYPSPIGTPPAVAGQPGARGSAGSPGLAGAGSSAFPGDLSVERFYDPTSLTYQPKMPLTTPLRVVGSPEDAQFHSPTLTPGAPPTYFKPPGYSGSPWAYGPLLGEQPIGGPTQATQATPVPGRVIVDAETYPAFAEEEPPPDPTALAIAPPSVTAKPATQQQSPAATRPSFPQRVAQVAQSLIPGGSFLGPRAVFGLGNAGSFTPSGAAGAGGTSFFNQQPGAGPTQTTQWRQGSVTGNPAMSGTMWNRSGGNGSVGYVTDPITGSMIYTGSPNSF